MTFNITIFSLLINCIESLHDRVQSEGATLKRHLIEYRLKKAKCMADSKQINETITVLNQYKIKNSEMIIDFIDKTIINFGTLVPRYLNKLAKTSEKLTLI